MQHTDRSPWQPRRLGPGLLVALALSVTRCDDDTSNRPLPLTDIGASLGEGFATDSNAVLEGGGSSGDAVAPADRVGSGNDNDAGPIGMDARAADVDGGGVAFNDLGGQPTSDGATVPSPDGGGFPVPDNGVVVGPADTGPTGAADTGPVGPADTGPTGPADTGPTGPADTGPTGPADTGF